MVDGLRTRAIKPTGPTSFNTFFKAWGSLGGLDGLYPPHIKNCDI